MRCIIGLLITAALYAADTGLILSAGIDRTGSATVDQGPNIRIEGRLISNIGAGWTDYGMTLYTLSPTGGSGCSYSVFTRVTGGLRRLVFGPSCKANAGGGDELRVDLTSFETGAPVDLVFRAQWNNATSVASLEVWGANGTGYVLGTLTKGAGVTNTNGAMTIADYSSGTAGTMGFLRVYSTVVSTGGAAPKLAVVTADRGDVLNVDFDNSVVDNSPNAYSLSGSGGSYTTLPIYPPTCDAGLLTNSLNLSPWNTLGLGPTLRAGVAQPLQGENSSANDGSTTLTYYWLATTKPTGAPAPIIGGTDATSSISGTIHGTYNMQLTVVDSSAQSTTCSAKYGFVATGSNDVVIPPPGYETIYEVTGPVKRFGTMNSTMEAYLIERSQQQIAGYVSGDAQPMWETPKTGTVSITNGTATLTGDIGTGTNFQTDYCSGGSSPDSGSNITFNLTNYRVRYGITSCNSATSITLSTNWIDGNQSGITYSRVDNTNVSNWVNGSSNIMYYDSVQALYAAWLASGQDDYLTYARLMADSWWQSPYLQAGRTSWDGMGGVGLAQRLVSMVGMFIRAMDEDIVAGVPGTSAKWGTSTTTGLKAVAYQAQGRFTAWTADANSYPSELRENSYSLTWVALSAWLDPDSSWRTTAQGYLTTVIGKWSAVKQTNGNYWSSYLVGDGERYTGTVTNGSTTVTRASGAAWTGALVGVGFCRNYDRVGYTVASVGDASTLTLNTTYQGVTGSGADINISETGCRGTPPLFAGITVQGLHYAAMAGNTDADDMRDEFADYLRINAGRPDPTGGLYYWTDSPACPYPSAEIPGCIIGYDAAGSRSIWQETGAGYNFSYLARAASANRTALKVWMDTQFALAWGSDGTRQSLPDNYKYFAFMYGKGGALGTEAASAGGETPLTTTPKPIKANLADIAAAVDIVVDYLAANGEVDTSSPCTSAACTFNTDARQGYLYRVRYRNGSAANLAVGEYRIVN